MANENSKTYSGNPLLTEFGAFYPTGHILVAFEKEEDAQKVREDLMAGGYDSSECETAPCNWVADAAQRNLDSLGFMARIGASAEYVTKHLEVAKQGATFILIYAPSALEVERAMRVVHRVPFILAHRYTRLTIHDMSNA